MCKCAQKFDFEHVKRLAIVFSNETGIKVAVCQMNDKGYNYYPFDFAKVNNKIILYSYPE